MSKKFLILSLVLILLLSLSGCRKTGLQEGIINADEGSPLQIQVEKNLSEIPEPGMANIFISTNITMENSKSPAKLLIQNSENNNYAQQVRIKIKDTEEEIYSSLVIDPGYKIESDYLNTKLKSGVYDCIAEIDLLNLNDYSYVNTMTTSITITIK